MAWTSSPWRRASAKLEALAHLGETGQRAETDRRRGLHGQQRTLAHVAAGPLARDDEAHRPQTGQRLADDRPGDTETIGQFGLGREFAVVAELAALDQCRHAVGKLVAQGQGRRHRAPSPAIGRSALGWLSDSF